jgi:hypothetical protein
VPHAGELASSQRRLRSPPAPPRRSAMPQARTLDHEWEGHQDASAGASVAPAPAAAGRAFGRHQDRRDPGRATWSPTHRRGRRAVVGPPRPYPLAATQPAAPSTPTPPPAAASGTDAWQRRPGGGDPAVA